VFAYNKYYCIYIKVFILGKKSKVAEKIQKWRSYEPEFASGEGG
jgi:hypothetical protein